jgi:hypothetical protein
MNTSTNVDTSNDNVDIDIKKLKKCIILCNGPSVVLFNQFKVGKKLEDFDFITVNKWNTIYKKLEIKTPPKYVIVSKNSFRNNITNILKYRNTTTFYGINSYSRNNYKQLKFGPFKCYNKTINFLDKLKWTGIYAIQLALKMEYDEIHVFGFTGTNGPCAWEKIRRKPIQKNTLNRVYSFFDELDKENIIREKIRLYENKDNHPLSKYIYYK